MRPTPMEVLRNLHFFEQLLTEAGVENAKAKVSSLHTHLLTLRSLTGWLEIFERDLRCAEQGYIRWPSKNRSVAEEKLRMVKRTAPQRRTVILYRQRVKTAEAICVKKIASWPELEYDASNLVKTYDSKTNKRKLRKRSTRRRLRFVI